MDFIKADLDRLVALEMEEPARAQAALTKISTTTSLEEASRDSDVVLEADYENLDLKQQIFRDLDAFCPDRTILANSASTIISSRFAEVTRRPDRDIGCPLYGAVLSVSAGGCRPHRTDLR